LPFEDIAKSASTDVLKVEGLSVGAKNSGPAATLIREITFSAAANECLVLIGESGSGKSTLARALTSLFPPNRGLHTSGGVSLDGKDLLNDSRAKALVRYVLQEPGMALNPALRIGAQLKILTASRDLTEITARLRDQDIDDAERVLKCYPHEISVGMAQRILLAAALHAKPRLLICDEPTSAVDLESRELIVNMLLAYRKASTNILIVVTHDLVLARRLATNIAVLYNGLIVEIAPVEKFYSHPLHPYSRALLSMAPGIGSALESMPDVPPADRILSKGGCVYAGNCARVQADCRLAEPALELIEGERSVRCPYWK
jgi:oligopeptide/dipeptide ABC transporter ATP-binding protein